MWDKIILQAVLTVTGVVASSVATYYVASYKAKYEAEKRKQQERDEMLKKVTKALQMSMLRDLRNDAKDYLTNGSIAADEAMNFEEYYLCYEDLGENGRIDNLVQRVRSLPIHNK